MIAVFAVLVVAAIVLDRCAIAADRMDAFLAAEAARAERGDKDDAP